MATKAPILEIKKCRFANKNDRFLRQKRPLFSNETTHFKSQSNPFLQHTHSYIIPISVLYVWIMYLLCI